jgi:hypothetical protein
MNRLLRFLMLALAMLAAEPVVAAICALPGRNGSASPSGIVNTYFPGTASVSAGATTISLGAASGALQGIQAGDLLLVIQMQDAQIDSRNDNRYGDGVNGGFGNGLTAINQAGRYEFVRALNAVSTSGGTLQIAGGSGGGLQYAYNNAAATASVGQRRFQIVRVPQYDEATIAGTVSALPWNGATGGVVAIDVARRLTFAGGTVSASGLGFRGGAGRNLTGGSGSNSDFRTLATNGANASKGEGIAGTPRYLNNFGTLLDTGIEGLPNGSYGRGAPANAGGGGTDGNPSANDQNTGGGGGANAGAGGQGGHAWCSTQPVGCAQTGGHPGAAVSGLGAQRIVMGGGGGAGTTNNNTGSPGGGFASSGAAGGGIVIVRAGEIAGFGTLSADGESANSTVGNDANGGGGAGGTILVAALRLAPGASLSTSAAGGNGGSNTGGGAAHGPGGGGGGGLVASNLTLSANVAGGSAGTTANGGSFGPSYGAGGGNGGAGATILGQDVPGLSSGGECTPTITKSLVTSPVPVGGTSRMEITVVNNNPTTALTALAFTDNYPSGLVNAPTPNPTRSCATAATLSAPAGGGAFAVSAGSIAAGGSCTYSVTTRVTSAGDKLNQIAAGALTGAYGSYAVASLEGTSATLIVSPPLTAVKSSQPFSDPVNGTTDPKLIPGGYVGYTITVANPASYSVDGNSIVLIDPTPANLALYVLAVPGATGPVRLVDGSPSSGLSLVYSGLASTTDDLDFSNNGGASWTYVPSPNAAGVDPAVTHIRIRPRGTMAPGSTFSLQLGYAIN